MRLLFFFSICLFILPLRAEYRAFSLLISAADGSSREVISTLDPDQYRGYHPVKADETVSYTQTWRCKGRTGDFQATCPNPHLTEKSKTEAASDNETRTPAAADDLKSKNSPGPAPTPP